MATHILDRIVAHKRTELARLPDQPVTPARLDDALRAHGPRRDFAAALRAPHRPGLALIAEVKKASPSAGIIRPDFDPVRIATDYHAAGADCLSILTDESFFQGSLAFLRDIRESVPLPLLRKDFVIDARQILEAIEWGADAVLLIVAILDDRRLRDFHRLATDAGLAALVEVHDEAELDRALAAEARLIGVNNRDLRTFTVDLATTERLAARLEPHPARPNTLLIAESGIRDRDDVRRLQRAGAGAILVGESLMRHTDLPAKVRELME
ncbi:MAG: indole-3-glycerol phosphate synthase TrpC [Verrucomicrobiae bacterium]|nr:indole-3-glycerol phosphate synthase TrpC [Verrucomicrobiae bacterium]